MVAATGTFPSYTVKLDHSSDGERPDQTRQEGCGAAEELITLQHLEIASDILSI